MNTKQAEKHIELIGDLANTMCMGLNGFEIRTCLDALSFAVAMIIADSGNPEFIEDAMKEFNYKTTKAAEMLIKEKTLQ